MTGSSKGLPQRSGGYTLLELLVAISIFSIVVIMMAGLISRLVFIERRSVAQQALEEDVRFAVEIFSREARLAFSSTFALNDGTGQSFVMRNQNGICVNYRLENGVIERAETSAAGSDCTEASFADHYTPLTSSRIRVEKLRFDIPDNIYNQADARLDRQGFVTLMLTARGASATTSPLELQTTIASRQVKAYEEQ